jgi:hypothetical protein
VPSLVHLNAIDLIEFVSGFDRSKTCETVWLVGECRTSDVGLLGKSGRLQLHPAFREVIDMTFCPYIVR